MEDVSVYKLEESEFDEFSVTSAIGKHPGGAYPNVFENSVLVKKELGTVFPFENFTIDVTSAFAGMDFTPSGSTKIAFGLSTSTEISRFCALSKSKPRPGDASWCYPRLEMVLSPKACPAKQQPLSCSMPAGSPTGPLDAMCSGTAPTFPSTPAITDWRVGTVITTTTTTTTTTQAPPIKEGRCRYNDHVYCPWPHSDIMCSGDQCCPDQSTCPSSQFAQAQGCNLKKYDCTAFLPANWTCRESEEVLCPGTDITCSGNTCCPNNSTCPSATVEQAPSCGPKSVDCQASLSADSTCAIGEYTLCPGTTDKCFGNQCCPDGSTCPSAPAAIAKDCGPKKATCELLEWDVKLRVTSVVFANVDSTTKDETATLAKHALANAAAVPSDSVTVELEAGSLIINAKVSAPGGRSQEKHDRMVKAKIVSESMRLEMEEMFAESDGLLEASQGDMVFEQMKGQRVDTAASTTAAPKSSGGSSTSLRVGEVDSTSVDSASEAGAGTEMASSATIWSLVPLPLVVLGSAMM